jgi:hypothetical protein
MATFETYRAILKMSACWGKTGSFPALMAAEKIAETMQ